MMLHAALLTLLLQAAPAAKATVGGVVVNASTGEPIANVRVSLARTDMSIGPYGQMLGGDASKSGMTISGETLAAMRARMEEQSQSAGGDGPAAAQAAMYKAIPVAEIFEIIVTPSSGVAVVPSSSPPVMTDGAGRFTFNDVMPGNYTLFFSGARFANEQYGQRSAAGSGVSFALAPNQAKTDIVMRLSPVGAISGRIHEQSGDPAVGVPVQIVRFSFDETGKKQLQSIAQTLTDDHGDYRMFYLTPGRYYLAAGHQEGQTQSGNSGPGSGYLLGGGGYLSRNVSQRSYALTYYPGVLDDSRAGVIEVQPGADLQGVDLLVVPQQSYRVRGRVVDSTAQPPQHVDVVMRVQSDDLALTGSRRELATYNPRNGTFEIQNVSSGTYTIIALDSGPPTAEPDFSRLSADERTAYFESSTNAVRARPRAVATVRVANRDVDGVVLTLGTSGSIGGRFRVESDNPVGTALLSTLRIQLRGQGTGGKVSNRTTEPEYIVVSAAAGSFRIDNVLPGEYRLVVQGLPPGFFVKDAHFGDADALNGSMIISNSETRVLDIVLSSNVGTLSGDVRDASGRLTPGIPVVLIPLGKHDRPELFRPAMSDIDGRFTIPSIAPGEYTLTAWESLDPYAYFDPEVIAKAETSANPIHIAESSNQAVSVVVIPAGQ